MNKCLFSAPADFLTPLLRDWPFNVEAYVAWTREDLRPDPKVSAWITNSGWAFRLGDEELDLFPKLKIVVTPSTGTDHIDVSAVQKRGIEFYSLLDRRKELENISASSEYAFLMLLSSIRKFPRSVQYFENGIWRDFNEEAVRGHELLNRRIGLVGMGRIGRRLTQYCAVFGAKIAWFDPYVYDGPGRRCRTLADLFDSSDSVIICCTLTDETKGMINSAFVLRLPIGGTLINVARGEIICESDLANVMKKRPDIVCYLDVIKGEFAGRQVNSPLMPMVKSGNVVVTPHIAGCTYESQSKAAKIALDLVAAYFQNSKSDRDL